MNKDSKLIFRYEHPEEEAITLCFNFEQSESGTIYQIHDYCKRFVITMGYTPETVERVFGESDFYYYG